VTAPPFEPESSTTLDESHFSAPGPTEAVTADHIDLDAMDADFVAVERALARLADGTYWTDEVSGQPIPDDVLVADPTARRATRD
jgi:RNA polymerase-binding transcription factor DksA